MFQSILLLASLVGAHRVQLDDATASTSVVKFGASCVDLQTMFHNRVAAFKASLDEHPNLDELGRAAQTRVLMRTYGMIRTFRRARTCAWVIENDGDDLDQARGIVQTLLARNPCADVARSELQAGASAETQEVEIQAVHRALSVLLSDNCEAAEVSVQPDELNNEAALEAQLNSVEEEAQDAIEEFADDSQAAFIQTDSGTLRGLMRGIEVVWVAFIFMTACVQVVGIIILVLMYAVSSLVAPLRGEGVLVSRRMADAVFPVIVGVRVGTCLYTVFNGLLPRYLNKD